MSIPAWRKVEYTDDGCSIYQCLSCYETWEGRSNPEWSKWKFCPYCSVAWEKQIVDKDDKVYTRRNAKYNKLDRAAEATLEVKHYEGSDGSSMVLLNWDWISWGIRFDSDCCRRDDRYQDLPNIYQDYMQQVKIAKLIKELARNYSDNNKICTNFFMFSHGYELRIKIVSRITGDTKYIYLTDGVEKVIRTVNLQKTA